MHVCMHAFLALYTQYLYAYTHVYIYICTNSLILINKYIQKIHGMSACVGPNVVDRDGQFHLAPVADTIVCYPSAHVIM